jgi:hypothetical protein
MKLSRKILALALTLGAALAFTGCGTLGKDYFVGTWSTGLYTVSGAEAVAANDTTSGNVYEVTWYFNGSSQSVFTDGVFYQIRKQWSSYGDAKAEKTPTSHTFYFGTYTLDGDDSELKSGYFNLSYKYGIRLHKESEKITEDQLIYWAKNQNKNVTSAEDDDDGNLKTGAEWFRSNSGLKDGKLIKIPKGITAYNFKGVGYGENDVYCFQVALDDDDNEVCSDIETFQFEFSGTNGINYTNLVATADTTDSRCITTNEWLDEEANNYITCGCDWSEFSGSGTRSFTRISN